MSQQKTHWFWDIAVLWPYICFAIMVFALIFVMVISPSLTEDTVALFGIIFGSLAFLFYVGSIIVIISAYVYAIHRLYTGTKMSDENKKTWLILIVLFNFITIPILHFMHLRVK